MEDFPCSLWPLAEGCGGVPSDPQQWDAQQTQAVESASELLWRLTAGRYGLCPERLRPCRSSCLPSGPGYGPYVADGRWFNTGCTCTTDRCGCGAVSTLHLPGPVHVDREHPLQVTVDGQPVTWQLYDRGALVRTDGGTWPLCQRLDLPADEPGTWLVTYYRGIPVPPGGKRAVAMLASEFHKACTGDRSCKLPARVRDVQREGVSYTMVDPQDFLDQGRTGLTEVDMWLRAVNPRGQSSPSTVWSPDLRGGRAPRG